MARKAVGLLGVLLGAVLGILLIAIGAAVFGDSEAMLSVGAISLFMVIPCHGCGPLDGRIE